MCLRWLYNVAGTLLSVDNVVISAVITFPLFQKSGFLLLEKGETSKSSSPLDQNLKGYVSYVLSTVQYDYDGIIRVQTYQKISITSKVKLISEKIVQ